MLPSEQDAGAGSTGLLKAAPVYKSAGMGTPLAPALEIERQAWSTPYPRVTFSGFHAATLLEE